MVIITIYVYCLYRIGHNINSVSVKKNYPEINFNTQLTFLQFFAAPTPHDTPESRAKKIFSQMDVNGDGQLTEEEFVKGCLQDDELSKILTF